MSVETKRASEASKPSTFRENVESLAWAIYAATLAGRAVAGLHGRRAAYFAVVGFTMLVLTLGAGLFLPGRHGS